MSPRLNSNRKKSRIFYLFKVEEDVLGPSYIGKKIHFSRRSRVFANSGGKRKRRRRRRKEGKEEERMRKIEYSTVRAPQKLPDEFFSMN